MVTVDRFINYIDYIHKLGVDAVIMQDIGMIDLVRKTYPNLEIHASTQAHIHNLEGVKLCEELGIKRVVLARETPIKLIEEIKKNNEYATKLLDVSNDIIVFDLLEEKESVEDLKRIKE